MNYSTRVRVADLPALQSKNVLYTYTAIYFTHTKKSNNKKNLKWIKDTGSALLMRTLLWCASVLWKQRVDPWTKINDPKYHRRTNHRHQPIMPHSQSPCLHFTGPTSLKAKNTFSVVSSQTLKSHLTEQLRA